MGRPFRNEKRGRRLPGHYRSDLGASQGEVRVRSQGWTVDCAPGPQVVRSPTIPLSGVSMLIPATQLRVGMLINYQNDLYRIMAVTHITPGNWRGMVQTKMRSVRSGTQTENRFRSEDKVDRVTLDQQEMEFLYGDGDGHHFMNTESFEQIALHQRAARRFGALSPPEPARDRRLLRGAADRCHAAEERRSARHRHRARPEDGDGHQRPQARHH